MRNWEQWQPSQNVINDPNRSLGQLVASAWASSPASKLIHQTQRFMPNSAQQSWYKANMPAQLPTTPLRDPANPQGATTWDQQSWSTPFGGAHIPQSMNQQSQPIGQLTDPSLYDLHMPGPDLASRSMSFGGALIPQTPQQPQDIGPLTDPWRWGTNSTLLGNM